MQWHRAFIPNNAVIANNVARFLRSDVGFEVTVAQGHINEVRWGQKTWQWSPGHSIEEMVHQICTALVLDRWWQECLDSRFPEILTIGKYTKLPLPKDIVNPPPAAASSPLVKEDSRLLPLPEGVTAMRVDEFINLITRS